MRTRVCITIDTEFSIAGAFSDRTRQPVAEPYVWCNVDGHSQGLGFMLECFRKYGIEATFFVEALNRYYFKNDPMRPIAQRIRDEGHEVQLHAHPCWSIFQHADWWERAQKQGRMDDFAGRAEDDTVALLAQGIETFRDWGVAPPEVFRSGNLQHDDALFRALKRVGIPYSSNVALAIYNSGHPDYQLYSGQHMRHGVMEMPVLTFSDWQIGPRRHLKALTIAGTSFDETRQLLAQANAAGIALVVILTHPFEFIQRRDINLTHTRTHALTQQRLTQLCQFVADNPERYEACGLASAAKRMPAPSGANTLLQSSLMHSLPRMASQVTYEKYGSWMLARAAAGAA